MSIPRYPEYKDSGVEWLGEVPMHWRLCPLKFLVDFVNGMAFKPENWAADGVPIIRIENLNDGSNFNFYEGSVDVRYHVNKGDLLFGWSGNRGTSFGPFLWQREGLHYLNQHIFRLADLQCDQKWLFWALKAVTKTIEDQAHGIIGMVHVTKGKIGGIHIPAIPTSEQVSIAAFLDHETAKIDALIQEQQGLIKLLKEKRQAVISHAVTKGLDPSVPMKDSGVEWLGEVPDHWQVSKFGYISRVVRGGSPRPAGDPELFNGSHSPWVTVAEITKDDEIYLTDTETFLTRKGSEQCRIFRTGTLLTSNSGATLGVPKILSIDANANDGVVGFEDLTIDKEFAYFYLGTLTATLRERIKQGSGQPNLNTDIVKSIEVPVPPRAEVSQVVSYVKKIKDLYQVLANEALEAIDLLQERRSALISAAVTGKIDVRNWQPPADESAFDADIRQAGLEVAS